MSRLLQPVRFFYTLDHYRTTEPIRLALNAPFGFVGHDLTTYLHLQTWFQVRWRLNE
jgi:hypothetical protein